MTFIPKIYEEDDENPEKKDIFEDDEELSDEYKDVQLPPQQVRIHNYIEHKPLGYGKKFYIGEFIAERFIQIVAFLSIGFIIAIFYYVFQESIYAFKAPEKAKSDENTQLINSNENSQAGDLKPQSYSPDTYTPDSYSPDTYTPDSYSSEEIENNKPELSNNHRKSSVSIETSGGNEPATFKSLLEPNDYIDNEPRYVWQPVSMIPKYSLVPLAFGALKATIIGVMIAAPIAILAAIFTVAFAPRKLKEIIKPAIEILAGFPSVVIGFFCLITLATVVQQLFGTTYRLNAFVGGLGMSLAVIPIIYTVTEDALSAVPKYMKEASLALGASRWQTAYRVMLPAAVPGVFAAIILGFGRAFGETMIALMATGNAALISTDIFESIRTMSATIGAEMAEVEFHSIHYGILFLIGAILFVVTFSLNALAEFYVRKKLMKKFQGS